SPLYTPSSWFSFIAAACSLSGSLSSPFNSHPPPFYFASPFPKFFRFQGFKPQGKYAPMAPPLCPHNPNPNFTYSSSAHIDTNSLFQFHHSETTANPDPFDDVFGVEKGNSSLNSVNLLVLCIVLLFAAVSGVPDDSVERLWDEAHKEEQPARQFTNLGRRSKMPRLDADKIDILLRSVSSLAESVSAANCDENNKNMTATKCNEREVLLGAVKIEPKHYADKHPSVYCLPDFEKPLCVKDVVLHSNSAFPFVFPKEYPNAAEDWILYLWIGRSFNSNQMITDVDYAHLNHMRSHILSHRWLP
ncbi:hypothetical protein Droror1_Dr00002437, partial [Drosera rotundifolia]